MTPRTRRKSAYRFSKQDKAFIQTCAAARYSRASTFKALQAFRTSRGKRLHRSIKTRRDYVNRHYSKTLKLKHIRNSRRTVYENMLRRGYTPKGRRQKMLALINRAMEQKNYEDLMELPEFDSPT